MPANLPKSFVFLDWQATVGKNFSLKSQRAGVSLREGKEDYLPPVEKTYNVVKCGFGVISKL